MSRPVSGQNVPKGQGSKFRRESGQTGTAADEPALRQSVPKHRPKYRRKSEEAKSATGKFRHENTAEGAAAGGDADAPPTGKAGAGKATPDKNAKRLQKSKLRMEKSGEKVNAAKEKLAAQKPPKKRGPVKKAGRAVSGTIQGYVHGKIFQVEDENVGVEGAHRSELVGEAAVRGTSRFVKRRIRSAPVRAVRRAESKNIRATADYQFRKAAEEHPELNKNVVSRLWQKRRLKKQYQKQARSAAKQEQKPPEKPPPRLAALSWALSGAIPWGRSSRLSAFCLWWGSSPARPPW